MKTFKVVRLNVLFFMLHLDLKKDIMYIKKKTVATHVSAIRKCKKSKMVSKRGKSYNITIKIMSQI